MSTVDGVPHTSTLIPDWKAGKGGAVAGFTRAADFAGRDDFTGRFGWVLCEETAEAVPQPANKSPKVVASNMLVYLFIRCPLSRFGPWFALPTARIRLPIRNLGTAK